MSAPETSRPDSTASDAAVLSPLAGAPKFSPPSTRNVSPARRALHERSNSQTNQFAGPTIRIVDDPGKDIYSKTPFPSQPSQILPPLNAPGYAFEHRGRRVSEGGTVANAVAKLEASKTLVPKPLQHSRKAARLSASTSTSEADTSLTAFSFSPSSTRFSQTSTPPSSPSVRSSLLTEKGLEVLEEVPSSPSRSTIRLIPPSTSASSESTSEAHALTPRASAASLASTASVDTLLHHRRSSSNFVVLNDTPSTKGHKYTPSSSSNKKKQASTNNTPSRRPTSQASLAHSLAFSDITSISDQPRPSTQGTEVIHEARATTLTSGTPIHYPIVRAPSANSLWAESRELPSITSRMNHRNSQVHHWSSQLSTIHSESEPRSTIGSPSFSVSLSQDGFDDYSGRANIPSERQAARSVPSSDNLSTSATDSSVAIPLPLFSPLTGPSHNDERGSDEALDTVSPLQSPPLRLKRSGLLRRFDSDSRSTLSASSSRPSSAQSDLSTFITNTIPGWARVYYRKGERVSIGPPESLSDSSELYRLPTAQSGRTDTPSEGNASFFIYRPRNRPHERLSQPETLDISDDLDQQEAYIIGPERHMSPPFTPRLRQDRRSQAQLSAWKAPSFDENFGSMLFSRQNRQIVLFCLGFLCPLLWMVAAVLPIPPDPQIGKKPRESQMDIERQLERNFGPVDDKSHKKATWWRNLNRVMSGLGTLLIGVIVSRS
ncbi:hypothetical protein DM02DRAFT_654021 [Periconia macrospinosa]|uniref:Serine-rich protein n=1 Tax=Periconia macrospinosa TaxID=97972 RepID=A0A2V1DXG9_9PLEO|nr:hypothetical protein DM02DRAFT_654021 [Periconia macrospinosa]